MDSTNGQAPCLHARDGDWDVDGPFVCKSSRVYLPPYLHVSIQGNSSGAICAHSLPTVHRRFSTGSCISSTDAFLSAVCISCTPFFVGSYRLRLPANIIFSTILKRLITMTLFGTSKARASSMLGFLEISTRITFRYAPNLLLLLQHSPLRPTTINSCTFRRPSSGSLSDA